MNGIHITAHGITRYRERVEDLPDEDVRRILSAPVFIKAADIGADVKLPGGQRVIIVERCVVTVKPRKNHSRRCYGRPEREEQ